MGLFTHTYCAANKKRRRSTDRWLHQGLLLQACRVLFNHSFTQDEQELEDAGILEADTFEADTIEVDTIEADMIEADTTNRGMRRMRRRQHAPS